MYLCLNQVFDIHELSCEYIIDVVRFKRSSIHLHLFTCLCVTWYMYIWPDLHISRLTHKRHSWHLHTQNANLLICSHTLLVVVVSCGSANYIKVTSSYYQCNTWLCGWGTGRGSWAEYPSVLGSILISYSMPMKLLVITPGSRYLNDLRSSRRFAF